MSDLSKATPRPWLYQQGLLWRDTEQLMPTELLKVAGIGYDPDAADTDVEAQANAALIVKAVNMYDELISVLRGCADAFETIGNCPPVYNRVITALAKDE